MNPVPAADSVCNGSATSLYSKKHLDPVLEAENMDSIAIVGMSFKFPGGLESEDAFWKALLEKRNTATEFPKERLTSDGTYHPQNRQGSIPVRGGHFLTSDISQFDAPFFSISDTEAASLDPQQRGLLEATYRALENAGQPIELVSGSNTSVFTGCFTNDWQHLALKDAEQCTQHAGIGFEPSILANRLSWYFNLKGTSFNIDSACSSSLVCVDLACKSLQNKDADMAIAAGCNLIFYPDIMHALSNLQLLSPDSQSYSFDSRANGYSRGEGFGVLVLKRVHDAIRDNDCIRAVIRGSGSNHDGRTTGLTNPSIDAQSELVKTTYTKAGVSMTATRFVEAHGTGTAMGDPIEASAIGETFRSSRQPGDPLYVGALKSNIGHLEGASGIAGVIKTVLVLEKGIIPPNANLININPRIDVDDLRIKLPQEAIAWPIDGQRRASVNSFGFGGTNAHVILDDAFHYLRCRGLVGNHHTSQHLPQLEECTRNNSPTAVLQMPTLNGSKVHSSKQPKLLAISAGDKEALKAQLTMYAKHIQGLLAQGASPGSFLDDFIYTMSVRRTTLPWRFTAIADSVESMTDLNTRPLPPEQASSKPALCLVYNGQGAQYPGNVLAILEQYDAYRRSIAEAERYLQQLGCKWKVREELYKQKDISRINDPQFSQPITTILQVALTDLLHSFNIHPTTVIGHSSGEIAAAYCKGAISKESAWKLAYFRGVISLSRATYTEGPGAMMAVALSKDSALKYLDRMEKQSGKQTLTVACINSPKNVTIAGEATQIEALHSILVQDGILSRRLIVEIAYHTPYMNGVAQRYHELVVGLDGGIKPPHPVAMISTVLGEEVQDETLCTPQYWVDNMTSPVLFASAIEALRPPSDNLIWENEGTLCRGNPSVTFLLEIGFHSSLRGPLRDSLRPSASKVGYESVLVCGKPPLETVLNTLGSLFCHGYPVDLELVNSIGTSSSTKLGSVLCNLPEYPFSHMQRYWDEGRINGSIIYPAAGMLVMAIEAAKQVADTKSAIRGYELKDVEFLSALNVPTSREGIETHLHLRQTGDGANASRSWSEFRLFSYNMDEWYENCRGSIRVQYHVSRDGSDFTGSRLRNLEMIRNRHSDLECTDNDIFDKKKLYATLHRSGYGFGPSFQLLYDCYFNAEHVGKGKVAIFKWPEDEYPQPHVIHPCTLDALLHLSVATLAQEGTTAIPTAVPHFIRRCWIANHGLSMKDAEAIQTTAWLTGQDGRSTEFDIFALDEAESEALVHVLGLKSTIVAEREGTSSPNADADQICYHLDFKPDISLLSPQQLSGYCEQVKIKSPEPVEFFEDLTFLLLFFLTKTISELERSDISSSDPHLLRYFDWANATLERYTNDNLPYTKPEWTELFKDEALIKRRCKEVEETNGLGRAYVATGRQLTAILKGKIDALEFLFSSDLLEGLYREVNSQRTCFDALAKFIDAMSHKDPNQKIIEIGSGTGGTTEKILSCLASGKDGCKTEQRCSAYYYTDISASFFESAQTKFAHHPNVHYKVFNVELDPEAQMFECGSFDMVVAANVLHATSSLEKTLRNVRRLLKSGGYLVLYEPTSPEILRTAFITGLLAGWWLSSEPQRKWGPTLSCESWDRLLRDNGFSGNEVELPDFWSPECREGTIIISKATPPPVTNCVAERVSSSRTPGLLLVIDTDSRVQQEVAHRLCAVIPYPCHVTNLSETVEMEELGEKCLVFLQELQHPWLFDLSDTHYKMLQRVTASADRVLWVTQGGRCKTPEYSIANGLFRVLRNEEPKRRYVTLELDVELGVTNEHLESIWHILKKLKETHDPPMDDMEYTEAHGILQIPRVVPMRKLSEELFLRSIPRQDQDLMIKDCPPLKLTVGSVGLLDTLHFVEDEESQVALAADEIDIEVRSIGLNFRDCLMALGRVPSSTYGSECSGTISRAGSECAFSSGDRVVMSSSSTFKTYVRGKSIQAIKIPDTMTFQEAASIPTQFCTAWQAIHEKARLQKGESILIHSAAGGTGQAAIQVAQYIGGVIYATVGSSAKRDVLRREYGIPEDHIFYSRDSTFAESLMLKTNYRGVDVILNSLAGDSLVSSWECIAPHGRFIELGKRDILSNSKLPMYPFMKNASFMCFDGFTWQLERPAEARHTLETVFRHFELKTFHAVHPLHVYSLEDTEQAFRSMQDGKHVGKIVLELHQKTIVKTTLNTRPSFYFDDHSTYVIAGGLGGLGRSVSRWLVARGAKNLILLSRSGVREGPSQDLLDELGRQGVAVRAPACDITDRAILEDVLRMCQDEMPPIKGCIQGSMVLRDSIFESMEYHDWRLGTDCKTIGSWNLHSLLPRNLDFFVMLSSASGIVGLHGQANYAAGNSYLDALARYRVSVGERAVSLDLGALMEDGLLAENPDFLDRVLGYGALNGIGRNYFHAILDYYCNPSLALFVPSDSQPIIGLDPGAGVGRDGMAITRQALLNHLSGTKDVRSASNEAKGPHTSWKERFSQAESPDDATRVVAGALVEKLQRILESVRGDVDMTKSVAAYGVDSLLAVELRSWLAMEFQADISLFEISSGASFSALSALVVSRSKVRSSS
ncbi:reducing type I polyketide synthase [Lophiotrema nucula]|uniref:Reducing type I polyketide synthase n=1 Tax=Lophiotrema nucula TaxID=690887 RepID=A0A6A5ZC53_9PLEO|nr:reducing type I polyketide synthase [Lophiotrema nucula]